MRLWEFIVARWELYGMLTLIDWLVLIGLPLIVYGGVMAWLIINEKK